MAKALSSFRQRRWLPPTIDHQRQQRGHSLLPTLPTPLVCWPLLPLQTGAWSNGYYWGKKGKTIFSVLLVILHILPIPPQQEELGGLFLLSPTSPHPYPLPQIFSSLHLHSSSSDQQNSDFPTLLRNAECVLLSHVFTSHRTQHEGYTEVCIQIPFFCKNETFLT